MEHMRICIPIPKKEKPPYTNGHALLRDRDLDMSALQPPDSIVDGPGDRASRDRDFFDAVQRAVDEKGLDRVSQDDMIRYSGIPRTTLYRRYGNRDAILTAFVLDRTAADLAACKRLATGEGSLSDRFENILVFAIMAAHRHGWLQRELNASNSILDVLANAFELSSEQTLVPILAQAKESGACRCPAPLDELRRWLMDQIFNLSRQHYASEEEARRVVRTYVLPVLALEPVSTAAVDKIDFIYRHIKGLCSKNGDPAR
jgi:AcrR family transcriptional regulator